MPIEHQVIVMVGFSILFINWLSFSFILKSQ